MHILNDILIGSPMAKCRKCRDKKSRPGNVTDLGRRPRPPRRADKRAAERAKRRANLAHLRSVAEAADKPSVELSTGDAVSQGVVLVGVADAELLTQTLL